MESLFGNDRVDIRDESLIDFRLSDFVCCCCCSSSSFVCGLFFCRPLRRPVSLLGVRDDGDVGRFRVLVIGDDVVSNLFDKSFSDSCCCSILIGFHSKS
jgi:hypothetical protein